MGNLSLRYWTCHYLFGDAVHMERTGGWKAIGAIARARRERLGLKQDDVARRGGPGVSTIGKFERGAQANYPWRTQHQIERALGWRQGVIDQYVRGVDQDLFEGSERLLLEDELINDNLDEAIGHPKSSPPGPDPSEVLGRIWELVREGDDPGQRSRSSQVDFFWPDVQIVLERLTVLERRVEELEAEHAASLDMPVESIKVKEDATPGPELGHSSQRPQRASRRGRMQGVTGRSARDELMTGDPRQAAEGGADEDESVYATAARRGTPSRQVTDQAQNASGEENQDPGEVDPA